MITISESDDCLKVFKVLYKTFTKTGGFSTSDLKVVFYNNGIRIKFSYVCLDIGHSYDLPYGIAISNPLFVSAILAHFETSHEDISIEYDTKNVKIDSCIFSYTKEDVDSFECTDWHMKFSSEQWNNLEKKFDVSLENYKDPEKIDCIFFAINEGEVFIVEPSYDMVKIEKPEALIQTVSLEQSYGHSCNLFSLPKKIWEIFKGSADVFLGFYNGEEIRIHSRNIQLKCFANAPSAKYYNETYISKRAQEGADISNIKNAVLSLEKLVNNLSEDLDGLDFAIDKGNITYRSEVVGHIENNEESFSVSMKLLIYLLKEMDNPKMKRIEADRKLIQIFDDKTWAYFFDSEI